MTSQLAGALGFINAAQRTIYVFDADLATPNQSTCNAGCTGAWPPVAPPAGVALPAPFSMFVRGDGTMQLAYAGRPLYTFAGDAKAGDTHGDGLNEFGGIWHIARPQASSATPGPSPKPPPMGIVGY